MSGQSKKASLAEAITNIGTGTVLGMLLNYYILPAWGYTVSVADAFSIGLLYSAISFVRSYFFRRVFNWLTTRRLT